MGGAERNRPKSLILVELWREHREELQADWLAVWSEPWIPATFDHPGNYGLAQAWRMTRVILRRHDSQCWAALIGAWYIPSPQEEVLWAEAAADNRIEGHSQSWRPWLDSTNDPLRSARDLREIHERKAESRAQLKKLFHIND